MQRQKRRETDAERQICANENRKDRHTIREGGVRDTEIEGEMSEKKKRNRGTIQREGDTKTKSPRQKQIDRERQETQKDKIQKGR